MKNIKIVIKIITIIGFLLLLSSCVHENINKSNTITVTNNILEIEIGKEVENEEVIINIEESILEVENSGAILRDVNDLRGVTLTNTNNQKELIIKDFWNWIVLKQNETINNDLGYTTLYLNNVKLIWLKNSLVEIYCENWANLNVCRYEKLVDSDFIKNRVLNKFEILENDQVDINSKIKILYIWWYEWHSTYLIDISNQKIFDIPNKWDIFVNKVESWKSWTYILYEWRWSGSWLIFIDNWWSIKTLFEWSNDSETVSLNYITIYDFELMLNKKVKLLYRKWGKNESEIIDILE